MTTMRWVAAVGAAVLLAGSAAGAEPAKGVALFDGKTLQGWKEVDFGGHGPIKIKEGGILEIGMGASLTGLVYTNEPVRMNYEITLEGRRTMGSDFFCGLTFPVGTNSCSLILGGWGGGVTGVSSIDSYDASENSTTGFTEFKADRWYAIRLRVTARKIEAWLDDKQIVDADTEGKRLGMRPGEIEMCVPLGLATWETTGELKNLRVRKLEASEVPHE